MKLQYTLKIDNPSNHFLSVNIEGEKNSNIDKLKFFIPSWSPGSYLMREYSKNIRSFTATSSLGEPLYFDQPEKGVWQIDWKQKQLKSGQNKFSIHYEVYCHELTVRTSHIDQSHAFLHGPSILMGLVDQKIEDPSVKIYFPTCWSHISTGLEDISQQREKFIYQAKNYDELIDTPIEIGCHQTDGFQVDQIDHELAFYGKTFLHDDKILKKDIKTIVEYISSIMQEIPYTKYTFITHFVPKLFGGLEHSNSTALQFCSMEIANRKGYLKWLSLVAHEYFHTWNIKRIRPVELGPFNYLKEATTKMLWLAEGLTSFVDELFVYQAGLCSLTEYLEMQVDNFNKYLSTPGKKFHTLEDSSFSAWVKLYRPDENYSNSSVSYYLKGGIVFFMLNILLFEKGKSIKDFLQLLWDKYKSNPTSGLSTSDIFTIIKQLGDQKVLDSFETWISTTEDIDIVAYLEKIGLAFEYDKSEKNDPWIGITPEFRNDRVIIKSVVLDSPAYKDGLNAGDEILAINDLRILKNDFTDIKKILSANKNYTFTISRLNTISSIELQTGHFPKKIKKILITNQNLAEKCLRFIPVQT